MEFRKIEPVINAADIPSALSALPYYEISICNWPEEYPYRPKVKFSVAHSGEEFYINYKVEEQTSRAAAGEDMGRVWEDSCVECFCAPEAGSDKYYNIECNCIGKVLLCCGEGRHDRRPAPSSVLSGIRRWASLGSVAFAERPCGAWEVALAVPASAFFESGIKDLSGLIARANFYKCGDLLQTPHFLSFAPIDTQAPDFHRPEFFTPIEFER